MRATGLAALVLVAGCGAPSVVDLSARDQSALMPTLRQALETDPYYSGAERRHDTYCAIGALSADRALSAGSTFVYGAGECMELHPSRSGRTLEVMSGSSIPVRLTVRGLAPTARVVALRVPGDGADFAPDLKRDFPPGARSRIDHLGAAAAAALDCEILDAARERTHHPAAVVGGVEGRRYRGCR